MKQQEFQMFEEYEEYDVVLWYPIFSKLFPWFGYNWDYHFFCPLHPLQEVSPSANQIRKS